MKCPQCSTDVPAGEAICPSCDFVVDVEALNNPSPPPARKPGGNTGVKKAVKRPAGAGPASGVKKPADGKPFKRAMPDAPARKLKTPPEQRAPAENWRPAPSDLAPPPQPHFAPGERMVDPDDFWAEIKVFVLELSMPDKLAFIGALTTLLACFFPWKDTITEGDVLGLMSLGALVFVVSVMIIVAIIIRTRQVMPRLHALIPWLVQFGGACFSIVWCLVYVKLSWDSTMARSPVGNYERWVSSPSPGVFIAMLTSVVTLAGTLLGLKEKPRT